MAGAINVLLDIDIGLPLKGDGERAQRLAQKWLTGQADILPSRFDFAEARYRDWLQAQGRRPVIHNRKQRR